MDRKAKILVVEDEFITRADIRDKLMHLGYEVPALTSSGEEAIRLAGEIIPDLILMDITLDGKINGIQAAKKIKESHAIPIIYLTAHSDEDTVIKAQATGPFGYLIKPFDERMLQILIEITLSRHSWESQLKISEERYRSIAELSDDYVIILNPDLSVSYLNGAASRFFNLSPEEILGRMLSDTLHNTIAYQIEEHIQQVFSTSLRERITDHFMLNDEEIWLDTTFIPIRIDGDQVDQVIGVLRDITVQMLIGKEMERHGIERIEKNMEQFQILNDEIRNPLQSIALLVSLEETQYTEKILENVARIDDLVKKLDIGWVESEKVRSFLLRHYQHGEVM